MLEVERSDLVVFEGTNEAAERVTCSDDSWILNKNLKQGNDSESDGALCKKVSAALSVFRGPQVESSLSVIGKNKLLLKKEKCQTAGKGRRMHQEACSILGF